MRTINSIEYRSVADPRGYQGRAPCRGITYPISLICMSTYKASAAKCLHEHQTWSWQPAIRALPWSPSRRLTLSVHFTWWSTTYQTTCTVCERSSIKGTHQCKPTRSSSFALRQPRSKFFNFHAVFGKNLQKFCKNNMFASTLHNPPPPQLWEILDQPLQITFGRVKSICCNKMDSKDSLTISYFLVHPSSPWNSESGLQLIPFKIHMFALWKFHLNGALWTCG